MKQTATYVFGELFDEERAGHARKSPRTVYHRHQYPGEICRHVQVINFETAVKWAFHQQHQTEHDNDHYAVTPHVSHQDHEEGGET